MPKPEIIQHEIPADGDWDGSMLVCVPVVVKAPTEEATRAAAVKFIADFTRVVDGNRFVRALSDIPAYVAMGQVRAKIAGASQKEITRRLTADGVPSPRGTKWHQATVSKILKSPVYIEHGLIDEATWEKAEAIRVARTRTHRRGRPPAGRHLFRKGMLRCGLCGEAMVPRTSRNRRSEPYEVYLCYGRIRDKSSCPMTPQRRAVIDGAIYEYFAQVALDVDATREAIAETLGRRISEVQALRAQAEAEVSRARAASERIERDYLTGELGAASYERLGERIAGELAAAEAELERLVASEREIERDGELADAEQATLERLTEIRRAIAGEIDSAESVDAVRAALMRLFDGFILHVSTPERVHVELARPDVWIEPVIASGEELVPAERTAVTIKPSASPRRNSFSLDHAMFAPIPVGGDA